MSVRNAPARPTAKVRTTAQTRQMPIPKAAIQHRQAAFLHRTETSRRRMGALLRRTADRAIPAKWMPHKAARAPAGSGPRSAQPFCLQRFFSPRSTGSGSERSDKQNAPARRAGAFLRSLSVFAEHGRSTVVDVRDLGGGSLVEQRGDHRAEHAGCEAGQQLVDARGGR